MKILLVFDSSNLENVGCKCTSLGLKILYSEHNINSVYAEDIFYLSRKFLASSFILRIINKVDFLRRRFFCRALSYVLIRDPKIINSIKNSDVVLINGEGAIHHDRLTGLMLISIGFIAKKMNKKVFLVNATIQDVGEESRLILSNFDRVVVRDIFSYKYLKNLGVRSTLGMDAAWIFMDRKIKISKIESNNNKVLVTGGVNFKSGDLDSMLGLINEFKSISYLYIDNSDISTINYLKSLGFHVDVVYAEKLFNKDVYGFFGELKKYKLILSGRHHINIFAYYLGVSVVTFKSNTYKIEGTINTILSISGKKINSPILLDKREKKLAITLAKNNFI